MVSGALPFSRILQEGGILIFIKLHLNETTAPTSSSVRNIGSVSEEMRVGREPIKRC
jgi:hypothetical protein